MRNSIYRITLDLHHDASQVQIKAKQNDVARKLYVSLTEDGKPYQIEEGCSAVIMIKKPDGTILLNDCDINLLDSIVMYDFTAQTVASVGLCECEIRIYGTSNVLLTSARFTMLVAASVYQDGQVESSSEFTALTSRINECNTLNLAISKTGTVTTVTITKKDGTTASVNINDATDEQVAQSVSDWLDDHPEATTTVEDNSLTTAKFAAALRTQYNGLVSDMDQAKTDILGKQDAIKAVSISLPSASWVGSVSPFTQVITISGSTAASKVDLQPDVTTLDQLMGDGVSALYVVNNNNVLTAYALTNKPTADLTVQGTVSEVTV